MYAPLNASCTFEEVLGGRLLPWNALCCANLLFPAREGVFLWLASIDTGFWVLVVNQGCGEALGWA